MKKGKKIPITERDQVIATILPVERGEQDSRLLPLVKEGFSTWKGGKATGTCHPVKIKRKAVSDIVLEGLQELRRKIYSKAKTEKHWRFWVFLFTVIRVKIVC